MSTEMSRRTMVKLAAGALCAGGSLTAAAEEQQAGAKQYGPQPQQRAQPDFSRIVRCIHRFAPRPCGLSRFFRQAGRSFPF